jgi:hypothetical protein
MGENISKVTLAGAMALVIIGSADFVKDPSKAEVENAKIKAVLQDGKCQTQGISNPDDLERMRYACALARRGKLLIEK